MALSFLPGGSLHASASEFGVLQASRWLECMAAHRRSCAALATQSTVIRALQSALVTLCRPDRMLLRPSRSAASSSDASGGASNARSSDAVVLRRVVGFLGAAADADASVLERLRDGGREVLDAYVVLLARSADDASGYHSLRPLILQLISAACASGRIGRDVTSSGVFEALLDLLRSADADSQASAAASLRKIIEHDPAHVVSERLLGVLVWACGGSSDRRVVEDCVAALAVLTREGTRVLATARASDVSSSFVAGWHSWGRDLSEGGDASALLAVCDLFTQPVLAEPLVGMLSSASPVEGQEWAAGVRDLVRVCITRLADACAVRAASTAGGAVVRTPVPLAPDAVGAAPAVEVSSGELDGHALSASGDGIVGGLLLTAVQNQGLAHVALGEALRLCMRQPSCVAAARPHSQLLRMLSMTRDDAVRRLTLQIACSIAPGASRACVRARGRTLPVVAGVR